MSYSQLRVTSSENFLFISFHIFIFLFFNFPLENHHEYLEANLINYCKINHNRVLLIMGIQHKLFTIKLFIILRQIYPNTSTVKKNVHVTVHLSFQIGLQYNSVWKGPQKVSSSLKKMIRSRVRSCSLGNLRILRAFSS